MENEKIEIENDPKRGVWGKNDDFFFVYLNEKSELCLFVENFFGRKVAVTGGREGRWTYF